MGNETPTTRPAPAADAEIILPVKPRAGLPPKPERLWPFRLGAILGAIYLMNFTLGLVELPDNLPFVGNMDEAAVTALFLGCMRRLGHDWIPFGKKDR